MKRRGRWFLLPAAVLAVGISLTSCGYDACLDNCWNWRQLCLQNCANQYPEPGHDRELCRLNCQSIYVGCQNNCYYEEAWPWVWY